MKNITIKKLIVTFEQAQINPKLTEANIVYVKECLTYEMGVNNHMAQHISNIKKTNSKLKEETLKGGRKQYE